MWKMTKNIRTGREEIHMWRERMEGSGDAEAVRLKCWRDFLREEDGMGTVEIVLIIVVLVGLVIIFKGQITRIVADLFDKITSQTGQI